MGNAKDREADVPAPCRAAADPEPWNLAAGLATLVIGAAGIVFWERRMRRLPVKTGLGAVALCLVLAGCGGDSTSASEEYANGVCSSLSTWVTDVQATVQSLTDAGLGTSRDDIRAAFDQTTEATDTLVNDLEQLGAPDTEDGQEAKSQLDGLSRQLRQQLDIIERALDSGGGVTTIAATVSTAVAAAANAVNTTYQNLKGLDPAGELRDAFESSDDCNSLGDQLAEIRS